MILVVLLILLILFWFLGYNPLQAALIPEIALFVVNGQTITLWNVIIFLIILALVGALPSPFREIAGVLVILWVLSVLGILAIGGLSSLIVIAIIVGLLLYVIKDVF